MPNATFLLIALILLLFSSSVLPADGDDPLVLAYYYTWYTAPTAKEGTHWGENATQFIFPPTFRHINSTAYPLIGPYDSSREEIVRWHVRLAKAAGIDAFLVDWWGPAGWQKPSGWTHDVFVNSVLPVAEQEDFKVVLFDETPQFVDEFETVKEWTLQYIREFIDSPAWLHIDGEPVWAIYQLWEGKLSADQGRELISAAEAECGPLYWIIDRMRARPADGGVGIELFAPKDWLTIDALDCISGYSMFSTWPVYKFQNIAPLYAHFVQSLHDAGKQACLPVHPGYHHPDKDYVIPRRRGQSLREFWRAAVEANADMLAITSFNEWPETTVIEPAITWPDPYLYLRTVAELQGMKFQRPPLPDLDALDPPMADFLQHYRGLGGSNAP